MARRFQFGLRNLLMAMLWFSIAGGLFAFFRGFLHHYPLAPGQWPRWFSEMFFLSMIFLILWCPKMAAGALFERDKRGMIIGAVVTIGLLLLGLVMVNMSIQAIK